MSDVKSILIDAGFKIVMEANGWYRMKPLHRSSSTDTALAVHSKTGHFKDWGTDEKGTLEKLIRMTTGELVNFDAPPPVKVEDLKEEIQIKINKEEIKALLPAYGFYKKRGISEETLKTFQSGYCSYGKMNDRYVFPIINPDGNLVGLSGRNMRAMPSDPEKAKRYIKWKHLNPSKNFVFPYYYNKDEIAKQRKIILVESIGNMLALWEAGIRYSLVTFGLNLSKSLLSTIISANPEKIILSYDNDLDSKRNNGQRASEKIEKELKKWFDSEQICSIVDADGLDLGEVLEKKGRECLIKMFNNSLDHLER